MSETKISRLANKVHEMLSQHPEKRFASREIAEWIFKNYPDERWEKIVAPNIKGKERLLNAIRYKITTQRKKLQKNYPKIKTVKRSNNRLLLYFTERTDSDEVESTDDCDTNLKEIDLYPILSEFLWSELQVYSKRIDERKSGNTHGKQGNRWLHPDIVGMENLSDEWEREIKDCVSVYADKKAKLWSFEVKRFLNRSNVRKAFFQAVSNSSWANFGYLVASEVGGEDTLKELRMLSSLHGIGFMQLNIENPEESEITIPAKERTEIDWDAANRLAQENKDFLEYIRSIREFCQSDKISPADWDTSPDQD